jgi:hypothetical protein
VRGCSTFSRKNYSSSEHGRFDQSGAADVHPRVALLLSSLLGPCLLGLLRCFLVEESLDVLLAALAGGIPTWVTPLGV